MSWVLIWGYVYHRVSLYSCTYGTKSRPRLVDVSGSKWKHYIGSNWSDEGEISGSELFLKFTAPAKSNRYAERENLGIIYTSNLHWCHESDQDYGEWVANVSKEGMRFGWRRKFLGILQDEDGWGYRYIWPGSDSRFIGNFPSNGKIAR